MRYIIIFSYDGSAFNGYQIQPSDPSVQETVEKALSTLLREPIEIVGAGRTDTGVNAIDYVAHFDFDGEFADHRGPFSTADLIYKLNAILPAEIEVTGLEVAPRPDFHARFDARRRTYRYFFHYGKRPFARKFSCRLYREVSIEAMSAAAALLLGEHDFSCFEKLGGNNKTSICTVYEAKFVRCGGRGEAAGQVAGAEAVGRTGAVACGGAGRAAGAEAVACGTVGGERCGSAMPGECDFYFEITANRFLRNMVRAIVGTLLEVGYGKKDPQWILELLEAKNRSLSGESVPANALFLTKIEY